MDKVSLNRSGSGGSWSTHTETVGYDSLDFQGAEVKTEAKNRFLNLSPTYSKYILGQGGFGFVALARFKNQICAVKFLTRYHATL